jgi:biopolymer transport protein ExbD
MSEHGTRSRPLRMRNVMGTGGRFGPNMTPMVDVVLVILIFFMAATTIAGQEWFLRTELPEAQEDMNSTNGFELPTPMLDVVLFTQGERVMVRGLGEAPRSLDALIEQIGAMAEGSSAGLILRIGAGDDVPYGSIVALHEAGTGRDMRVVVR